MPREAGCVIGQALVPLVMLPALALVRRYVLPGVVTRLRPDARTT